MVQIYAALACLLLLQLDAAAQSVPCQWTFQAEKKSQDIYEIRIIARPNGKWHVYSQFTPEGGPLATMITFSANPMVTVKGLVEEEGDMKRNAEPAFGGAPVRYYDNTVVFSQVVRIKKDSNPTLKGMVIFMLCDGTQCLSPETKSFSLELK